MTMINEKNKLSSIDLNTKIQEQAIGHVEKLNFNTIQNHYFKNNIQYPLIDDTCITTKEGMFLVKTFSFDTLDEKFIPFIKMVPIVRTNSGISVDSQTAITFIYQWTEIEGKYYLTIGIYAYDSVNKKQLYCKVDMYINNIQYSELI